jgi:hypothetical protein
MQLDYSYSRQSHNDVDLASRDVVRLAPTFFSVRPSAQASAKHVNCTLQATVYLGF